ncbi:MAG: ASPIC/UnbV domain-containing protein, partial [Bacteroidota bacterium]
GHGRSSITADYDQDGDLDLFLLDYNQAPHLYRNDTPGNASRSWLQVQLVGSTSNRDGIGGRVWIKAGGTWRVDETRSGSSLGGGDQSGVHFGLNTAASVDSLIVRWPSGARDTLTALPVNQHLIIHESVLPIQLDVVLEGPYAGSSTMRTDLTALLPGAPATAVDSVTVTVSDCSGATLSTAPAWLLANGTLRSIDDTADWGPKAWPAQGGCVTVAHRNHTPASTSSTLWDGVASLAPAWGTGAVLLTDSTPALAAGDADGSGAVNALDILANWLPVNGTAGYLAADANLDGVANAKDALLMLGRMVP